MIAILHCVVCLSSVFEYNAQYYDIVHCSKEVRSTCVCTNTDINKSAVNNLGEYF